MAAQVTYSLDFARGRAADLGCGDSVYGNTATDADDLRKDPDSKGDPFDMWRTTAMHMDSRLKLLRVVVTHNGTFTFDSCGSQYSVALGLYHDDGCLPKNFMPGGGGGGTCGELVHYDVIPVDKVRQLRHHGPFLAYLSARTPPHMRRVTCSTWYPCLSVAV